MLFKKGDIVTNGKEHFRIVSIDDKHMRIVNVNEPDDSTSVKEIARFLWNKYTIVSADQQPPEAKANKASKFSFSFDPETGEIIVTWPDGVKEERLQSIKGDKGESVFEEWCRKSGLKPDANSWQVFLKSLRGEDGQFIRGADAPTLYEEWKGRQPEGADISYTAFFNQIRGEKGKDGYEGRDGLSAYEIWKSQQPSDADKSETAFWSFLKGAPGTNGHEGADGKDGDTWIPYVNDGKLYFENARTKERTEVFDIRGIQGLDGNDGRDGDTWKPFFKNGEHGLYFRNQRGDEIGPFDVVGATGKTGEQGPRGESAYQIWLNEGNRGDFHDFLLWVAKHADKGADGEDGDTYIPHVEKGVLFFISEKTGRKIPGGNVVGPTGAKGDMGLPGHNIEHEYDYHDLKDFTCPVQEIPERLINESGDLNAYGSAEEHMRQTLNEINNIREEGAEESHHGSWIQEMFWWCSGADRKLLRMCPAEHSKYMGIGTVIFFTALMAFLSSLFAISFVFGHKHFDLTTGLTWGCLGFALAWGLMIFFLDRFITNTMYSDGKVTISWLELRSALPRILISIFLGIVISAPLELKIFDKEVESQLVLQKEAYISENTKSISDRIAQLRKDNDTLQVKIDERSNNANENISTENRIAAENQRYEEEKREIRKNYPNINMPYGDEESNPRGWKSYYARQAERDKQRNEALQNAKTEHNEILNDLKSNSNKEVSTIGIKNQITRNDTLIASYSRDLKTKSDSLAKAFDKSDGLGRRLQALHYLAYKEDKADGYKPWGWANKYWWVISLGIFLLLLSVSAPFLKNVVKSNKDCVSETTNGAVSNPKLKGAAVLYPWFAITALICGFFTNTLFNALPYYIFTPVGLIMILFILIDVSPVFYKMMLADGQYEQILHKEKSVTQDLIRLNFAQSVAQVNNSQVGKLTSMIFSKPWAKIQEILSKTKDDNKPELGYGESEYQEKINRDNEALFDEILDMKTAIIRAAYMAWYRDMRDSIIGIHKKTSDDQSENDSDESPVGGTSPKYERDSNDPHSGTPEDIFSDFEQRNGMGNEQSDAGNNEFEEDAEGNDTAFDSDSDNDEDSSYSEDDSEDATDHSSDNDSSTEGVEDSNYDSDPDVDSDSETNNNHAEETDSNPDSEWEQVIDDDEEEVDSDKNNN